MHMFQDRTIERCNNNSENVVCSKTETTDCSSNLPGLQILNNPCQDHLVTNSSPQVLQKPYPKLPNFGLTPWFVLYLTHSSALYCLLLQAKSTFFFFFSFYYRCVPVVSGWYFNKSILSRFVRDSCCCRAGLLQIAIPGSPNSPPPKSHSACPDKPSLSTNVSSKSFVEPFSIGFILFVLWIQSPRTFWWFDHICTPSQSSAKYNQSFYTTLPPVWGLCIGNSVEHLRDSEGRRWA